MKHFSLLLSLLILNPVARANYEPIPGIASTATIIKFSKHCPLTKWYPDLGESWDGNLLQKTPLQSKIKTSLGVYGEITAFEFTFLSDMLSGILALDVLDVMHGSVTRYKLTSGAAPQLVFIHHIDVDKRIGWKFEMSVTGELYVAHFAEVDGGQGGGFSTAHYFDCSEKSKNER